MPTTTTNLGLNKTNTTSDGEGSFVDKNEYFNFDTDLNDNWDKIDAATGKLSDLETTEKNSLVGAINEVSESVPDVSDLANKDLSNLSTTGNAKFANKDLSNLSTTGEAHFVKPNVAVTHTANTAVGTSSQPIYVNSSGVATACSGLDSNMRCTSRETISTTKPDVVIAQYQSGTSGYRIWASGYKEKWGRSTVTAVSTNIEVTFNTTYPFTVTPKVLTTVSGNSAFANDGTASANYQYVASRAGTINRITKTSFYINRNVVDTNTGGIIQWYAIGY